MYGILELIKMIGEPNLLQIPCDAFTDTVQIAPIRALVIGGQAVANLEHYCFERTRELGYADYVAAGSVGQHHLNATHLGIDLNFEELHFAYIDGLNDAFSQHVVEMLDVAQPHVIVMDMLGEDLAYLHHSDHPSYVAQDMYGKAELYREMYGVPVVMALSGIRRGQQMNCPIPVYDVRLNAANTHLQTKCTIGSEFIVFKRVKGFMCHPNGNPMSIEYWTTNGVVPGPDFGSYGFLQYRKQIKSALLKAIPKWIAFTR